LNRTASARLSNIRTNFRSCVNEGIAEFVKGQVDIDTRREAFSKKC
jgi:hypothetical protein